MVLAGRRAFFLVASVTLLAGCRESRSSPITCDDTTGETCDGGRCVQTLAVCQESASTLAVDSTSVYWGDFPSVKKLPLGGGDVVKLATGGGN
jgi:hypothetical protein